MVSFLISFEFQCASHLSGTQTAIVLIKLPKRTTHNTSTKIAFLVFGCLLKEVVKWEHPMVDTPNMKFRAALVAELTGAGTQIRIQVSRTYLWIGWILK